METMETYLFCTDPEEYSPEEIGAKGGGWSCSKTTRAGDRILVYLLGRGVGYEWRAVSDAEPDKRWKYACDVEHARTFTPEISIAEIRRAVSRQEWAPPHLNFRGYRSIRVPKAVAERLISLRRAGAKKK